MSKIKLRLYFFLNWQMRNIKKKKTYAILVYEYVDIL